MITTTQTNQEDKV